MSMTKVKGSVKDGEEEANVIKKMTKARTNG